LGSGLRQIELEPGTPDFHIGGDFIMESHDIHVSLIRYIGTSSEISIGAEISLIDEGCFGDWERIDPVTFRPESWLLCSHGMRLLVGINLYSGIAY
jgi:hypothetical protein